ncbi:hypothetical protein AN958_08940 [Leucoagaricus sp. SymC.cos]|nr:hypothetical protein AN958_08940 [Leucoagaricus sp. SymC.cos]
MYLACTDPGTLPFYITAEEFRWTVADPALNGLTIISKVTGTSPLYQVVGVIPLLHDQGIERCGKRCGTRCGGVAVASGHVGTRHLVGCGHGAGVLAVRIWVR